MAKTAFDKIALQMLPVLREAFLGLFSVRMSAVAFHLDYVVYPPLALAFFWSGAATLGLASAIWFLAGLASWTLAEYLLHRFALHHWPYFSGFHLAHHEEPRAMVAAPTLLSVSFFCVIALAPAWALLGRAPAFCWFSGFLLGYAAFALVHHLVHHWDNHSPLMRHFKKLHAMHHHGNSEFNFGVTTDFWDKVFGTKSLRR